jgi:tetratricopeptide (TPR) repeat protein
VRTWLRASVLVMLAGCPSASHALDFSTNVTAQDGVAAGGDIRDSTIVIGVPSEQLEALVRDRTKLLEGQVASHEVTIALLKKELDLNERQISAALNILGETNIPPERLAAKLIEIAERFKVLQAHGAPQSGDAPEVAQLKKEANEAIDDGNLARADELLFRVEGLQQTALDREQVTLNWHALDLAETRARRGDVAVARLRYLDAAKHFADAATQVPRDYNEQRLTYLYKEADAFYRQGDEGGDNAALATAIDRLRSLASLLNGERAEWHMIQNKLGAALMILGDREGGTARFEEALATFREVLKVLNARHAPTLEWAGAQNDLGNALSNLGQREDGTSRLEEAVAAYRAALTEWTHEQTPLAWALAQNNLGIALSGLGQREDGTSRLEEAVTAFREALKERTRERVPRDWATTQNNLGMALSSFGEREDAASRLEEAVTAFREALKERTLSRGAQRTDPRECSARLGRHAVQSWHNALEPRRARGRDLPARGSRDRLSRSAQRTDP